MKTSLNIGDVNCLFDTNHRRRNRQTKGIPQMIRLSSVFMNAPMFPLGQILATPGALNAIGECHQNPLVVLARHSAGDWDGHKHTAMGHKVLAPV
jgi:hypothetical protein